MLWIIAAALYLGAGWRYARKVKEPKEHWRKRDWALCIAAWPLFAGIDWLNGRWRMP